MKFFLSFVMLAALAVATNSASVQKSSRANLIVGIVRPGDVLLNRRVVAQAAIANAIQTQNYAYLGLARTNITSVQAFENSRSQYASVSIVSGGVGSNNVTVRMQSARGYGYNYTIDVYGR